MNVAGVELVGARRVDGGDICAAVAAATGSGARVFAKTRAGAPDGFFAADARGLAFLRVDGAPPLPGVIAVGRDGVVLEWVEPGTPTVAAAERFGRELAALHAATPASFGAPADGFIGALPLPNGPRDGWASFYVEQRVAPYLHALDHDERAAVERVCARIDDVAGPPEPPARIHGDLWAGNLLWAADGRVWLVDAAAAHGGHRETDLAMLQLFGAPHLERVLAAYDDVSPLADGWRERVPLHQLHPLLVHAVMFGGGYGARAAAAARRVLGGA